LASALSRHRTLHTAWRGCNHCRTVFHTDHRSEQCPDTSTNQCSHRSTHPHTHCNTLHRPIEITHLGGLHLRAVERTIASPDDGSADEQTVEHTNAHAHAAAYCRAECRTDLGSHWDTDEHSYACTDKRADSCAVSQPNHGGADGSPDSCAVSQPNYDANAHADERADECSVVVALT